MLSLEVVKLRRANETLTARNQRKKKAYRGAITRSVADGLQLTKKKPKQTAVSRNAVKNGDVATPAKALRSL